MKKFVLGLACAMTTIASLASVMATRQYVDNATGDVVRVHIPYELNELSGSTVQLSDHKASSVEINSATTIKLPAALPSSSGQASRCFQVFVNCPLATVPAGTKFSATGLSFVSTPDAGSEQDLTITPGLTLFCFAEIRRNVFMFQKIALESFSF